MVMLYWVFDPVMMRMQNTLKITGVQTMALKFTDKKPFYLFYSGEMSIECLHKNAQTVFIPTYYKISYISIFFTLTIKINIKKNY